MMDYCRAEPKIVCRHTMVDYLCSRNDLWGIVIAETTYGKGEDDKWFEVFSMQIPECKADEYLILLDNLKQAYIEIAEALRYGMEKGECMEVISYDTPSGDTIVINVGVWGDHATVLFYSSSRDIVQGEKSADREEWEDLCNYFEEWAETYAKMRKYFIRYANEFWKGKYEDIQ